MRAPSRRMIGIACGLAVVAWCPSAFGMQRAVRARIVNYEAAPVLLLDASAQLVKTYSTPTQFPLAAVEEGREMKMQRSRVRHLNRLNQQVPTYLLEGNLQLRNDTRRRIAAIQLTIVFLNAFRERIGTERHSLAEPLGPREVKAVQWSRNLPYEEIFEVFFIVTAIRFDDGTVWMPTEELIFFP